MKMAVSLLLILWVVLPQAGATSSLSIMTFNVENLFDTVDDPAKDDQTFLPLAKKQTPAHREFCQKIEVSKWREQCLHWDWSDSVLKEKMSRLSQVVRSVNKGRGPDVLFLQEVENKAVVEKWRKKFLGNLGYKPVHLIEGADKRGIDVAVLTRLPLRGKPLLHAIPFQNVEDKRLQDTRGILQVDLTLPTGGVLTVFSVHLPAPFHPVMMRVQALQFLNQLKARLPQGRLVIAAGDFNIPRQELQESQDLRRELASWIVTQDVACRSCRGTTYYPKDKTWSFLDMILLSQNFGDGSAGWLWEPETYQVVKGVPHQVTPEGFPASFEPPFSGAGVSDHFPIELKLAPIAP